MLGWAFRWQEFLFGLIHLMFVTVERHNADVIVQDRFDMHRPRPQGVHVFQRVFGVGDLQFRPAELVLEKQFAAILVVAVRDMDDRASHVGQAEQQPLLDLVELAALDLVVSRVARCSQRRTCCAAGRSRASGTRR